MSLTPALQELSLSSPTELFLRRMAAFDQDQVFLKIIPRNAASHEAFDRALRAALQDKAFHHAQSYMMAVTKDNRGHNAAANQSIAASPRREENRVRWAGGYVFTMGAAPKNPKEGWIMGSGGPIADVDVLLTPPGPKYRDMGMEARHFALKLAPDSGRFVIVAKHPVILASQNGKILTPGMTHALKYKDTIVINDFAYTFEFQELTSQPRFQGYLEFTLKEQAGKGAVINRHMTPGSVVATRRIGQYRAAQKDFARGTYGKIFAAWDDQGDTFAIKMTAYDTKAEVKDHESLMEYIGKHENVLELVQTVPIPGPASQLTQVFHVHAPLASFSLADVIGEYDLDSDAKLSLVKDFLSGLDWLHEGREVMHRDIKPGNLAVTTINNPRGVIIDLDQAIIDHETCQETPIGTLAYNAPEILEVEKQKLEDLEVWIYDRSVDTWAMGLSFYGILIGRRFRWAEFADHGEAKRVDPDVYERLQYFLGSIALGSIADKALLYSIKSMTEWEPEDRISPGKVLATIDRMVGDHGRGHLKPKEFDIDLTLDRSQVPAKGRMRDNTKSHGAK
ncbi:uncharacterized protein KY384_005072 [Bacidia gigantensis]|uniref:uncharacterized protein n=1 Tax=Bacidia gigantensis TaxID=2732470 RepID=UPI001D040A23|nr:uncharacterized protein KY384_005072 [Bacidia gigantensis]KAG8530569.1 hypothetical protein KY384_005072 [Bacidia gigantensis]